MFKSSGSKDTSRVDFDMSEPALPVHEEHLLPEIFKDYRVIEATLDALASHRNISMTNTILQVYLELDFGSTLYFVSKAIKREVSSAVKKMTAVLNASPRTNILSALTPFLFRETTSDVAILVEFFRITGTSYLQTVLQDMIVHVETHAKATQLMEGMNAGSSAHANEKAERLMALATQLVSSILKTPANKLPATLRYVCKQTHSTLVQCLYEAGFSVNTEESQALLHLVASQLLVVRFFSLGLTCPALYLLPDPRSEFSQDSCITLSNILIGLLGLGERSSLDKPGSGKGSESLSFLGAASPLHHHMPELSPDCEAFFIAVHKSKTMQATFEAHRAHMLHWLAQAGDFNELENRPTGPLAFFVLETYGSVLARWICENALEFLNATAGDPPLMHIDLFSFMAANKHIIMQMDADRKMFKPQPVLGPGIWNPVQYARAWKLEVKLPSFRTQDMFAWIPTGTALATPLADRSIIDWMIRSTGGNDFLIAIICQTSPSTKLAASVQKYIRAWKKTYPEVSAAQGQLVVVVQAPLSASQAISKKLAPNFPIIFDHFEHIASFFGVSRHIAGQPTGEEVTVVLADGDGRLGHSWENSPVPKTVLSASVSWLNEIRRARSDSSARRKHFRRGLGASADEEES